MANVNDVELNRFSRHVSSSPLRSANESDTGDVSLLDPSTACCQQTTDDALLRVGIHWIKSVADPKILKGGVAEDSVSAPLPFIANTHNELYHMPFIRVKAAYLKKI